MVGYVDGLGEGEDERVDAGADFDGEAKEWGDEGREALGEG